MFVSGMTNQVEPITEAFKGIDIDHAYIHLGIRFSAFSKDTIAAGGTLAFGFKTPATGAIHYRLAGITASADKIDTQIFEGATFTAATGTLITASNRNRLSAITSVIELRRSPTFTVLGTLLDAFSTWLPGTVGSGQVRSGSSGESTTEIILKQNTTYRFLATNGSSVANVMGFNFQWYEQ